MNLWWLDIATLWGAMALGSCPGQSEATGAPSAEMVHSVQGTLAQAHGSKLSENVEEMSVVVNDNIIKSSQDKCQYRHLTLPNGLQALLVSEEGLDKASAALDVHVGSFSDPADIPGLAHFLEHLLFMGTSKYPDENEYGKYLSTHSGHSNAFTAEEHTNFYFDAAAEHLEGALDRFAQFFIAPLFNPDGTNRELEAVNSEHKKNLQDDRWRIAQLERSLSNPEHPFHKFSTGDLTTLKDVPAANGWDIRKILIEFYKKHYSANLMKLVVYGREPLSELQKMVVDKFSFIPNNNFSLEKWDGKPLDARHFGKLVRVKTVKDLRDLTIGWLLPDLQEYRNGKPEGYYSHLLGHEGRGSILSVLKRYGWASSLMAGATPYSRGYSFFKVSLGLTEEGLKHVEDIIKIVFQYLQMLRQEGPQYWIWREKQRLDEIEFEFREKTDPSSFAHQAAHDMQVYSPELILKGPQVSSKYDAEAISMIADNLTAKNFRVTLKTAHELKGDNVKSEKWYGTRYVEENLNAEFLASLEIPGTHPELGLPTPNEFIPENVQSKHTPSSEPVMHPKLIAGFENNAQYRLWFKQDDMFGTPKGCFQFVIKSPLAKASPKNQVATSLFLSLLKDSLSEMLYEAGLAGLSFVVRLADNGIQFSFFGYDEKIPVLLQGVLTKAKGFVATEDRFHVYKDKTARAIKNTVHENPYSLSMYYSNGVQHERFWWFWQNQEALESITLQEVNEMGKEILSRCKVEALCHGNYFAKDATSMLEGLQTILNAPQSITEEEAELGKTAKFNAGQSYIFLPKAVSNVNSAIEITLQIGSAGDVKLRNLTLLFKQIFYEPFFDQLRTQEQLGYVVAHQYRETGASVGLCFLIQSERTPTYLDDRIEKFIDGTLDALEKMAQSSFEAHRQASITKLLTKKRSIKEETGVYWHQIGRQQYEFERFATDASYLRNITRQDLIDFVQKYVLKGAPERKKLAVHLWSKDQPHGDAYTNLPNDIHVFEKPEDLDKTLEMIPYTYTLQMP